MNQGGIMRTKLIMAAIVALFVVSTTGYCMQWNELIEQNANGRVNWSMGIIQATGIGAPPDRFAGRPQARPMALRAAKLDAMRNLLEITKGVRIDSATTVRDYVVQSDVIMTKINGMVKGARVVKREYMSDGTVEITMQMSLYGGFAQIVLPQTIKRIEPIKPPAAPDYQIPTPSLPSPTFPPPVLPPTAPPVTPPPPPVEFKNMIELNLKIFTGMLVNAKGLHARPAMSPRIFDENGQEIYGSAFVSREFAVQQGMTGYAKSIDEAKKNQRISDNPLIVAGLRTEGAGQSNIVISNADAAKIRNASEHLSFMQKCRVMIIVD